MLATAGVKGFAFTLGVGTIVSLLTAVVFTQALLGCDEPHAACCARRPPLGAGERAACAGTSTSWARAAGSSRSRADPARRRARAGDQAAQLRHRLRVGHADQGRAGQADRRGRRARSARRSRDQRRGGPAGHRTRTSATTSSRSSPASCEPAEVDEVQTALEQRIRDRRRTASTAPASGRPSASRWPTAPCKALIFSLLVICAYVAFRFDPKFAVPVLIAIFHDILITAGVYSLTGREVTSGTVAAFLTILGYSLYDTIIVFDRIRENVPRMPRAAFSQIVNRSMSEVLTRSLATSFSTLLAVGVAARLRRRHPAGLRLRDDGRDRLRYLLLDLHRLAGADRLEGTRAGLRPPARADRRARRQRAGLRRRHRAGEARRPTTRPKPRPSRARPRAEAEPQRGRGRDRRARPATATAATRRPTASRRRSTRPRPSGASATSERARARRQQRRKHGRKR